MLLSLNVQIHLLGPSTALCVPSTGLMPLIPCTYSPAVIVSIGFHIPFAIRIFVPEIKQEQLQSQLQFPHSEQFLWHVHEFWQD